MFVCERDIFAECHKFYTFPDVMYNLPVYENSYAYYDIVIDIISSLIQPESLFHTVWP